MLKYNKLILSLLSITSMLYMSACNFGNLGFEKDIQMSKDSTNELRIHLDFKLTEAASAYVKFWPVNQQTKEYYSQLSQNKLTHHIILVGLKGETTYEYQIIAKNERGSVASEVQSFVTEKFPINILHLRQQQEITGSFDGYILSQRRMVNGIIYFLDNEGDVVWYNKVPKQPKLSHWTDKSSILVLYGAAGHRNSSGDHIVEYDLYGNELLHINLSELNKPMEAHHDVRFDKNGDLLMLIYENKTLDFSDLGGELDQNVMGDKIVRMDKYGKVIWEWSVFDYSSPEKDTAILKTADDWSHANSLSIDSDGNYLISFRNFNQVWKIDSKNGNVIWKLGEHGNISMDKQNYFSGQHAFHVNRNGDYMVFDNGRKNRKTRILTFQVDELTREAVVGLNISLPDELYSDKMGNAYMMDKDNILVCAPRTNSLVVMNQTGKVLSHVKVGIPDPYRAEFVPSLYNLDHVK